MVNDITIRINAKTKKKLDLLKEHHRETYGDVVERLAKDEKQIR